MTDKPTDAVAFAQQQLDRCYESAAERGGYDVSAYCEARNALIAAVRAECAAKVDDAISEGIVVEAMNYASERQVQDPSSPFALCVASHIACEVAAALEAP